MFSFVEDIGLEQKDFLLNNRKGFACSVYYYIEDILSILNLYIWQGKSECIHNFNSDEYTLKSMNTAFERLKGLRSTDFTERDV